MTLPHLLGRLLLAGVIAVAASAGPLSDAVHAGPAAPDVPSDIAVLEGNKVFLVAHAVGVQIYSCNATSSGPKWELVAPRANLYGDNGQLIATHSGGPTWEARDGSAVVGQVEARVPMPSTIAWLRLRAVPTTDSGRLAGTTFIQRTATTGGVADPATCTVEDLGDVVEVPYTADYHFWKDAG